MNNKQWKNRKWSIWEHFCDYVVFEKGFYRAVEGAVEIFTAIMMLAHKDSFFSVKKGVKVGPDLLPQYCSHA